VDSLAGVDPAWLVALAVLEDGTINIGTHLSPVELERTLYLAPDAIDV
jgi:hypothetical protein